MWLQRQVIRSIRYHIQGDNVMASSSDFVKFAGANATYIKDLSDKVISYFDQANTVISKLEYPKIPTGEIGTVGRLPWISLNLPTITWPPSPNINYASMGEVDKYKKHIWEDGNGYLDSIQALLMGWVNTGGTGIGADVQQAIFDQDRERRKQTLNDTMLMASAQFGGSGFRFPNSILAARHNELLQKYQFDDTEASRNIVRTIADLAQKHIQWGLTHVTSIEQFHADFAVKYSSLFMDTMTHIVETYKADVMAKTSQADTEIRKGLATLDVFKTDADLEYKSAELKLTNEKYRLELELEKMKTSFQVYDAEIKKKIDTVVTIGDSISKMATNIFSGSVAINK